MIFSEKTVRIIRETGRDRNRESSLAHLEMGFLPINIPLAKAIHHDVRAGFYTGKSELLLRDIKQDVGLTGHFMRSIPKLFSDRASRHDPLGDLSKLSDEQVCTILTDTGNPARHDLAKASPQCVKRMRHAILACAGAETLADAVREQGTPLDRGSAYSIAYFRQLGLQLVAWNYPKIYARAVEQARKGKATLESYINDVLPQPLHEISYAIAQRWNVHPELLSALSPKRRGFDETDGDRVLLSKLVQHAESFAQLDNQDIYPDAAARWIDAIPSLAAIVGEDVIRFLPEKVHQACEQSLLHLEAATKQSRTRRPTMVPLPSARGQRFWEENKEIRRAPAAVQGMLRQVYGSIMDQGASRESLTRLISEVVPAAGFARGCVYGVRADRRSFVPLLWLNDKRATYFEPRSLYSPWTFDNSPAGEAPLLKSSLNSEGETVQFLSGLVGHPVPRGILFLELSPSIPPELELAAAASFRALRVALYDCLRLD